MSHEWKALEKQSKHDLEAIKTCIGYLVHPFRKIAVMCGRPRRNIEGLGVEELFDVAVSLDDGDNFDPRAVVVLAT
jgi:hypothetical protein